MTHATRFAFRLTLAALALSATTALAGTRAVPQVDPISVSPTVTPLDLGPASVQSTCTLGVTGAPAFLVNYLLPPNDGYYTLIDPAQCTACPLGIVTPVKAHALLNWRGLCTQPVSVGIYGATGGPGCYSPDPSVVICAPVTFNVSVPAAGNYDISFPLASGCCLNQPVFLKIEFVSASNGCSTSTTIPRLITTGACDQPCTSWNIYPGGFDDLCDPIIGFPGNPIMNLEVDCCTATPTHQRSWGTLKSHYR